MVAEADLSGFKLMRFEFASRDGRVNIRLPRDLSGRGQEAGRASLPALPALREALERAVAADDPQFLPIRSIFPRIRHQFCGGVKRQFDFHSSEQTERSHATELQPSITSLSTQRSVASSGRFGRRAGAGRCLWRLGYACWERLRPSRTLQAWQLGVALQRLAADAGRERRPAHRSDRRRRDHRHRQPSEFERP